MHYSPKIQGQPQLKALIWTVLCGQLIKKLNGIKVCADFIHYMHKGAIGLKSLCTDITRKLAPHCNNTLNNGRWWTNLVKQCCDDKTFICPWMSLGGRRPACAETNGQYKASIESPVVSGEVMEWPWNREGQSGSRNNNRQEMVDENTRA